jgi:hypothetical protein
MMDVDELGMGAARNTAATLITREDDAAQRWRDGLFGPSARRAAVAGVTSA